MCSRIVKVFAAGCLCVVVAMPSSGQTPALKALMREKLSHSQQLLDAVVTSRWVQLEAHAVALRKLTGRPAWMVLQSPEYARQTAIFTRALDDLVEAARRKDLEATPVAYTAMTMSCVQCHRQVARMRMADSPASTR
ncbi:MAG: hypothetical protein ABL971_03600 [Vicinamibacterales bacterium]